MTTKISGLQFGCLVLLYIIGTTILIIPSSLASTAKQDAWISALVVMLFSIVLIFLYYKINSLFPESNLYDINIAILGKRIGLVISILYLTYFLLLSSLVLNNIGSFITSQVLHGTPMQALVTLFILVVIYGAYLGLEVLGRSSEIFVPWLILFLLLLLLLNIPNLSFFKLQPIFIEQGLSNILKASITYIGTPYLELVVFLMILPNVSQGDNRFKAFMIGTIISSSIIFLIVLVSILVLGADLTARNAYPSYILGKKISIGQFLERIEVLVAIIWMFSTFFKMVVLYYSTATLFSQILNLRDYRILMMPLGFIIVSLSLIVYPNTTYLIDFLTNTWFYYAATFGILIPVVLLIVGKLKIKKVSSKS